MIADRLTRIVVLTLCGLLYAPGSTIAADTKVSGRIVVAGRPLGGGKIVLHLDGGEFLGASVSKDGRYAFQKLSVPTGTYIVTIEGKGVAEKYKDKKISALRVEVREGMNVLDFALQ